MTAAPGGSGFTLTVNGTEFVSSSVVNWNGAALATTFVTGSQLTAVVPASDIATASTATVTVTNPAPGGGMSNVMYFDVANQVASLVFSNFYSSFSASAYATIAADFNGDGKLDLASVTENPNVLFVLLGNGDGTFQTPLQYPVGSDPFWLFAGDFNGDGKLDIAVVNAGDSTVSILLGNGDGTFQTAKTLATDSGPISVVAGDFNGDGKLDLAVACGGSGGNGGSISVLLGNGDGTFQTHTDYPIPAAFSVAALTLGDFNGDGKLDVAFVTIGGIIGGGGQLFIYLGNGDGTFQVANGVLVPEAGGGWMFAADLNGDGKLDLVTAPDQQAGDIPQISVLIGNGDGTFQPAVEYSTGGGSPVGGAEGDFNADGKLDLATINYRANTVSILLGNGDGTFQSPMTFPTDTLPDSGIPIALAVGDFNGDGQTDLTVTQVSVANLLVLLQGTWPALAAVPPSVGFAQQNVGTSSAPQAVTLTNTGNATLDVSSIGITGANAGSFSQTNSCGATLAPSASCQVNLILTPSLPGTVSAAITITGNFAGPLNVAATGIGIGALASVSPPTVTFPSQYVGTSGLPQTATVTNTGNSTLTITNVTTSIADFGTLSNCTNGVPPNTNCTIGVFFDPTTSGTRTGTLIITDNASGSPQSVVLTGTGQDFSVTAASSSQTVSPGQTATYSLSVSPGGGFNQTVQLSCSGAPAQSNCSVSPSSVALNGSASQPVAVTVTTVRASAGLTKPRFVPPSGDAYGLWLWWFGALGIASVLSFASWRREWRRPWAYGLASVCLLGIGMAISGCGSGSSGGGTGGIQPGTYNLAVSGNFTSGSTTLTHTTKLTLVVQ